MAINSSINRYSTGKLQMVSFRTVCRSVWNHPFIVGILLFLQCVYKYFPSLFYILLSASPVFVCTAVILGALLIHGQPNNTKLQRNPPKICNAAKPLKTRAPKYSYSTDKDGNFCTDRFVGVRKGMVQKGIHDLPGEVDRGYHSTELTQGDNIYKGKGKNKAGFYIREKKDVQMFKDRAQNRNLMVKEQIDDQQRQVDDNDDQEEFTESETDIPSLEAAVSRVIRTRQETLPLLDCDKPPLTEPLHVSPMSDSEFLDLKNRSSGDYNKDGEEEEDEIDDSYQSSADSDEGTDYKDDDDEEEEEYEIDDNNYGDGISKGRDGEKSEISWTEDDNRSLQELRSSEMEKNEHLEHLMARINEKMDGGEEEEERESEGIDDEDDDDDDEDQEEEGNMEMEKSDNEEVAMWTEEDERNMRLVGNSELERNQRLENLLAKRRALRNFSMISERNLIDLEQPDLPFQVAPISTTRVNPFDTPTDNTNRNLDVPPIPGSAPSVTIPRKNPFDSPGTSPKASHNNLTQGNPKEEQAEVNHEPIFHTDSSTGLHDPTDDIFRSNFADINRKEATFRRYESFSSGYSFMGDIFGHDSMEVNRREATLRKHESFGGRSPFPSIFTEEKPSNFHMKPVVVLGQPVREEDEHQSPHKQSSEDSESTTSSGSNNTESLTQEDVEQDLGTYSGFETSTSPDRASSYSENKSEPSNTVNPLTKDKNENADQGVNADSIIQKIEAGTDDDHDTESNSSTLSEKDDRFSNTHEDECGKVKEYGNSPKASQDVHNISHINTGEDNTHVEPVYDTSPSGADKIGHFSSIVAEI